MGRRPKTKRALLEVADSAEFLERVESKAERRRRQNESMEKSMFFRRREPAAKRPKVEDDGKAAGEPVKTETDDSPKVKADHVVKMEPAGLKVEAEGLKQVLRDSTDVPVPAASCAVLPTPPLATTASSAAAAAASSSRKRPAGRAGSSRRGAKRGRPVTPLGQQKQPHHAVRKLLAFARRLSGGADADTAELLKRFTKSKEFRLLLPDADDLSELAAIGRNVVEFARTLPMNSPLRRQLLSVGAAGMETATASRLFKVSGATVRRSRAVRWRDIVASASRGRPQIHRRRIPVAVEDVIGEFWRDNSRQSATRTLLVKRGQRDRVPVRYQSKSTKKLFYQFRIQHPAVKIGLTKFVALRPRTIRPLPRYNCVCPTCWAAPQHRQRLTEHLNYIHRDCSGCCRSADCPAERQLHGSTNLKKKLKEYRKEVARIEAHEQLVHQQDAAYRDAKTNLEPGQCLVVMDFAAKQSMPWRWRQWQTDVIAPEKTMADLVIVVMFRAAPGAELTVKYYNFCSNDCNDDYAFVRHAWVRLLKIEPYLSNFDSYLIWSDGGRHHFKVKRTMSFFAELAWFLRKHVEYHFFASYHGKGPCDGHTGVWKQLIRRRLREDDLVIDSAAMAAEFIGTLRETTAVVLPSIFRVDTYDQILPSLDGMTAYHAFHFQKPAGSNFNDPGQWIYAAEISGGTDFLAWNCTALLADAAHRLRQWLDRL